MPMPPSASDWTRFKRLVGAGRHELRNTVFPDVDIIGKTTPVSCPTAGGCSVRAGVGRDQDQVVGSSKIRREASKWTDAIAARHADIITVSSHAGIPFGSFGRALIRTRLCGSDQMCPPSSTLPMKVGPLRSSVYQHSRII